MKQKMIAAITAKNEELISDILQQAQDDELLKELVELINLEPGKRKTIDDDLKQREKDTEEEFRRLKEEAWRPRIDSIKRYIIQGKTFNEWAREDPWAQDTGGEFVEGIPKRLLGNSEIDEVWMIAEREVKQGTGTEPEPETAQMKPKKERTKKKRTKKKRTKKKRTKKKKR